jgi:L-rhamnose-H+ transport protein
MVAGIILSSWAGKMREGPESQDKSRAHPSGSYGWAIATAIICGLLAPMLNYSFAFGQSISDEAVRDGASRAAAVYAIWPVAPLGGSIPNIAYAIFLLRRNATWKTFLVAPVNGTFSGSLMALLWMGAMAIYGVASVYLGPLGTSVGWALFQIFMIITANAAGVLAVNGLALRSWPSEYSGPDYCSWDRQPL